VFGWPAVGPVEPPSIEAALILAAGGEFAFVILDNAMGASVVSRQIGQAVLVAATLTMFLIPGCRRSAAAWPSKANRPRPARRPDPARDLRRPGAGRARCWWSATAGSASWSATCWTVTTCRGSPSSATPSLVEQGRRDGHRIYYGDASRVELLERCGLDHARAVVVTMDAPEAAEAVVAAARGAIGPT
jgi:CPA2 family monovalent cation:H+ antiporter-2